MTGHWPHKGSADQLLFDNCTQCLDLSRDPAQAIGAMEPDAFEAAWLRALDWTRGRVADVSAAEVPVLMVFLAMTGQMAKRGVPWGTVPAGEKAGTVVAA